MSVILIVVKSPESREEFGAVLQASLHHLVFSDSLEDGLRRVSEAKPDLVFCEHQNGIDGSLFIQRMAREIPVVLMSRTLKPDRQSELRVAALGASGCLQLPFTKVALAESISQHLRTPTPSATSTPAFVRQAMISDATELNFEAAVEEFLEHASGPAAGDGDTQVAFEMPANLIPIVDPEPLETIDAIDTIEPDLVTSTNLIEQSEELEAADPLAEPEIERTEATPSAVRLSKVESPPGGKRRALDESQLGKRLAKRIRKMHGLLDQATDYTMLGLDPGATPEAIDAAYFELSLEFHPDRFFLLSAGDLKEKIYAIFRRISQAYENLADGPEEDRRIVLEEITDDVDRVMPSRRQAEPFVRRAQLAIERGDLVEARLLYSIASAYSPNDQVLKGSLRSVIEQEQLSSLR